MPKYIILEAGTKVHIIADDNSHFTALAERSIAQIQREEVIKGFKEILLLKNVSGDSLLTFANYAYCRIPDGGFTVYSDFNSAWQALSRQSSP